MKPQNLIVLMSDEHDPHYMGASGHPFIRTPNLDRLAALGYVSKAGETFTADTLTRAG